MKLKAWALIAILAVIQRSCLPFDSSLEYRSSFDYDHCFQSTCSSIGLPEVQSDNPPRPQLPRL